MSKYYGTLESEKGNTTRAGHRYIQATAQTYEASVSVMIREGEVTISIGEGSTSNPKTELFAGSLADLLQPGVKLAAQISEGLAMESRRAAA